MKIIKNILYGIVLVVTMILAGLSMLLEVGANITSSLLEELE
jgi:hypothetical protein